MKPSRAAEFFEVPGRHVYSTGLGRGNVNDTYESVFRDGAAVKRIVLQRINRNVFAHPEWIMANMRTVTEHIERKVREESSSTPREWGFPTVIRTRTGEDFLLDPDGEYWRALTMVDSATSYERVRDAEHAMECGLVLGCFHRLVKELDPGGFHDTLPGFHNCPRYLERYDATVAGEDKEGRLDGSKEVERLQAFVEERRALAGVLEDARARGELKESLIHGDPKVDNIMLDDFTDEGIGIVDFDTVKPGLIHYDFGDALRSVCNPAGEDAANLGDVTFDVDLCEAFVKGYVRQARKFLSDQDRRYLYDSIRLLAFELGLRFLQDYLAGDVYFKVQNEEHNLIRARVQFKLCESVEINENSIRDVLEQRE